MLSELPLMTRTDTLRWLYVDFNSYFASVEQQMQPRLRGKPVIVVPVQTDSTCAIAASYEAKRYGIRTGTPVYEAQRLCPGLICVLGNHEKYVEYHHRIQDEIEKHIPITAVCSIDEVACRLMNNETPPARVREIALSIKEGLRKNVGEYIRCSIGVAPNRYLAKVATDLQKPDGLTILTSAEAPERLGTLTLRDLPGIGRNMEKRLNKHGIYDMKKLMTLDARRMRTAWGSIWGEKMWYLLRGIELPEEAAARRSIGHSHVLAPETREFDQARHVARRLVIKTAARLRRMEYFATTMGLSVRSETGARFAVELHCYRAQDSFTFLQMLESGWSEIRRLTRGVRLKKVSVTLYGLTGADALQEDLFEGLPADALEVRKKWEKISRAMDKLNHKFGRDTVVPGLLPAQGRAFSGTKVAFTRIPDMEEFVE